MFIIAKISDKYNNKVNTIINDIFTFSYDNHYIDAKQLLEKYYSWTLDNFHYGDILIYIPYFNYDYSSLSTNIPTASRFRSLINIFSDASPKSNIISQTSDSMNTGKLNIEIFPIDTKCVLFGPKNYIKEFIGNTIFTNLVEGVYIIKGQDEDLYNKKLIQKDYRVVVTKGLEQTIQLGFDNYNNITIIKDA